MNAYLLAGGRSQRMGRSKADLPFAGSTFARIVIEAAKPAFSAVYGVQRAGGPALAGVETIFESDHADRAPIFGVARALEHARAKCVVVAIDYPLITSEILHFIRDEFAKSRAPLIVPMWRGRAQMLCAGYSPEMLPLMQTRIATDRLDLRGLIDEAGGAIISEATLRERFEGEPLINVNTPAELEEAESLYVRS
jgi:molybdopterin-guanine dinucleotide biosynthesis protein A